MVQGNVETGGKTQHVGLEGTRTNEVRKQEEGDGTPNTNIPEQKLKCKLSLRNYFIMYVLNSSNSSLFFLVSFTATKAQIINRYNEHTTVN